MSNPAKPTALEIDLRAIANEIALAKNKLQEAKPERIDATQIAWMASADAKELRKMADAISNLAWAKEKFRDRFESDKQV